MYSLQNLNERDYDILNKYLYFFVTTEPNRMGFSPKCR